MMFTVRKTEGEGIDYLWLSSETRQDVDRVAIKGICLRDRRHLVVGPLEVSEKFLVDWLGGLLQFSLDLSSPRKKDNGTES